MKRLAGKKILFLGSNVGVSDMVTYAKHNGAITIVADWYPPERSYAKQLADEALLLSTADIEALCDYVNAHHVDGVFAGISEFNLLKAMEVARRCGLPFYCTAEQWEQVEHKDSFRKLCERHEVPCPATYFTGSAQDLDLSSVAYPAVLKPVDAATSKGVHICQSEADLMANLDDAFASSDAGRIIVEQFAQGDEFTAHYTIHKGKAKLASIDNRYPVAVHGGGEPRFLWLAYTPAFILKNTSLK